jgi:hypothetical protein
MSLHHPVQRPAPENDERLQEGWPLGALPVLEGELAPVGGVRGGAWKNVS